jgi:protein deglycase
MKEIIAVHLAEGYEEIEAVNIIDVLRRANIETLIVSVTGKKYVTGSHGITISSDKLFEEVDYEQIKMIVLPGGMPGARNLKNHEKLGRELVRFYNEGKPLGAICAAPIVLGNLKLLKNKKATCYPGYENELTGAKVTGNNVELSDNIITGKGAGVAIQFALRIVEMLKGKPLADELAGKLVFPVSAYT